MPIWMICVMGTMLFVGCNSGSSNTTAVPPVSPSSSSEEDVRAYQHGVDFLKRSDGSYWLVWASSGLPPQGEDDNGEWTHDVYAASVAVNAPTIAPVKLIAEERAQEPSSAAIAADGHIMITMEDAFEDDGVYAQTYAVYDASLRPIKPYRHIVAYGGHSGHVAAVGNYFVVFYSEGWVDGGGVDDLGSGDDVLLKTYTTRGDILHENDVAVSEHTRDWWPLLAGSPQYALLLWQRFVDDQRYAQLLYRMYDPETNRWISDAVTLSEAVRYYTYDVQYIETLERFVVCGTDAQGKGFARLLTPDGTVVAQYNALPPFVREAQPAVRIHNSNAATVVYPTAPSGLMVLRLSRTHIELTQTIASSYSWYYSGTDGIFTDAKRLYFISLTPEGLQAVDAVIE